MTTRFTAAFAVLIAAANAMAPSGAGASTGTVLIVANEDYATLRDARGARAVVQSEATFRASGFDVDVATDLGTDALRAALSDLGARLRTGDGERVVIVFSGYAINAAHGIWLMGTEARTPDFATIESYGVRLETLLALAGQIQGGAVVAIADYGFPVTPASGFQPGLPGTLTVPQGVTLVHGTGASIAAFLRDMAAPGTNLGTAVGRRSDLRIDGFNPPYLTFLPADWQPAVDAERQAWGSAVDADSVEGYDAYLAAYPNGTYAQQAQEARQRLLNTPERVEAALGLSRDERRSIQRDLTILGFDPRGIDGIFGRGTRAAVGAWQGANRFEQTGFLNRDQIFELAQQGARRAAQLEAEARERQREQERQDRAFWRDTGSGGDEAGMRAYLDRYPDGIFASIAQDRLDQIDAQRRAAAQARDRAAWDQAQQADTVPAYRAYLADYPQGAFADQATARIEELRRPRQPQVDTQAAQAEEDAMHLPAFSRQIIEQRLERLGLEPGPVDGTFDRQTRRAIRRYQRTADLPVTGYLTPSIVARLMAEGMVDILR
ncbi:MAG: peptidoglycan-binding protein [Rhodobacter sp.]|nr:peptidoglycan-binding protein [Paracoccaceae bacterium]MCC0078364.1 peptidoglycan-binding protein [Rhodobacter sp.]